MEKIIENIVQGVAHFKAHRYSEDKELFQALSANQKPRAFMITCADSRVDPALFTHTKPGEIFYLRNAGNIVPPYTTSPSAEAATIEFALEVLNIEHIIVCGHSDCGAMKGLINPGSVEGLPAVKCWLQHAEIARRMAAAQTEETVPAEEKLVSAIEENVLAQIVNLKTHPSVASRLALRKLSLYAWVYNIGSGDVLAFDPSSKHFTPLSATIKGIPFFASRHRE